MDSHEYAATIVTFMIAKYVGFFVTQDVQMTGFAILLFIGILIHETIPPNFHNNLFTKNYACKFALFFMLILYLRILVQCLDKFENRNSVLFLIFIQEI